MKKNVVTLSFLLLFSSAVNNTVMCANNRTARISQKQMALRQMCEETLDAVSAEMSDDTTLGEHIVQVYGWVLEGSKKPKSYTKEYRAFVKECAIVWKEKVSSELYAQLMQLNALGKKHAGMAGWKKAVIGVTVPVGVLAIAAWDSWKRSKTRRSDAGKGCRGAGRQLTLGGTPAGTFAPPGELPSLLGSGTAPVVRERMGGAFAGAGVGTGAGAGVGAGAGAGVGTDTATHNLLTQAWAFQNWLNYSKEYDVKGLLAKFIDDLDASLRDKVFAEPINASGEVRFGSQMTFLSLAAKKGFDCWKWCDRLISHGARTDIGSPLPVEHYRDSIASLHEEQRQSISDWSNIRPVENIDNHALHIHTMLQGLSQDQLQGIFDSCRSGETPNYFRFCFDSRLLNYFREKGVTITEPGVWRLLDDMMDANSGIGQARSNKLLESLNIWCSEVSEVSESIERWLINRSRELSKAHLVVNFLKLYQGKSILNCLRGDSKTEINNNIDGAYSSL